MKTLFSVHGDHPVLKRMDESGLDEHEASFLITDLKNAQYENIRVDVTVVIQEDDSLTITKEFFDFLSYSRDGNVPTKECDLKKTIVSNAFNDLSVGVGDIHGKLPITVEFSPMRLSRDHGHLVSKWSCRKEKRNSYAFDGVVIEPKLPTDIKILLETFKIYTEYQNVYDAIWNATKFTMKVEHPVFLKKPVIECDDKILNEREKVIKGLMLNGMTEDQAMDYLKPILTIMKNHDMVFYIP